jgi:hypothetical protein
MNRRSSGREGFVDARAGISQVINGSAMRVGHESCAHMERAGERRSGTR